MKEKAIKKANKPKRAKRLNPVTRVLLAIALIYVAGNMVSTCIKLQMQIRSKQNELNETNGKISSQSVKNEELNAIINGKLDREYYEAIAREKGYVTEGEIVYENTSDH